VGLSRKVVDKICFSKENTNKTKEELRERVEVTTSYLKKIYSRIRLEPKLNMLNTVEANPDNRNTI
jgi:hypothetical protein